jgi:hypothetical protein
MEPISRGNGVDFGFSVDARGSTDATVATSARRIF